MTSIGHDTVSDLFFQLNWTDNDTSHTDAYAGRMVNLWRDLLPRRLKESLIGKHTGDQIQIDYAPGDLFTNGNATRLHTLKREQFDPVRVDAPGLTPRMGRFYPKGALRDVANIFSENREPFRCVQIANGTLTADMGHPLADKALSLKVTVGNVSAKEQERGGGLMEWGQAICNGVGMQSRWQDQATDFFAKNAFERSDEEPDGIFYQKPRLVQHLDDTARDMVRQLYSRFVEDDMRVLDLMSSIESHLPTEVRPKQLTGVGMNQIELEKNPALTDFIVHDLNDAPALPFPTGHYDVALCTVSVEYLTRPQDVFSEVARVLRPGGLFIVSFSNRWFPPKAIQIWTELHEFERSGLVLEYFRSTNSFHTMQTYSIRGLMRPRHDKYAATMPFSDPVYAVWGQRD